MNDVRQALHATAALMDADDARCIAEYGAPVGIPVSFAAALIHTATHGPHKEWEQEWVRLAVNESLDAAQAWGTALDALEHQVFDALFPDGLRSPTLTADQVRAVAEQLTPAPQH